MTSTRSEEECLCAQDSAVYLSSASRPPPLILTPAPLKELDELGQQESKSETLIVIKRSRISKPRPTDPPRSRKVRSSGSSESVAARPVTSCIVIVAYKEDTHHGHHPQSTTGTFLLAARGGSVLSRCVPTRLKSEAESHVGKGVLIAMCHRNVYRVGPCKGGEPDSSAVALVPLIGTIPIFKDSARVDEAKQPEIAGDNQFDSCNEEAKIEVPVERRLAGETLRTISTNGGSAAKKITAANIGGSEVGCSAVGVPPPDT